MKSKEILNYSNDFLEEIINDLINLKIQNLSNPKNNEFTNRLRIILGKNFNENNFNKLVSMKDIEFKNEIINQFNSSRKKLKF